MKNKIHLFLYLGWSVTATKSLLYFRNLFTEKLSVFKQRDLQLEDGEGGCLSPSHSVSLSLSQFSLIQNALLAQNTTVKILPKQIEINQIGSNTVNKIIITTTTITIIHHRHHYIGIIK